MQTEIAEAMAKACGTAVFRALQQTKAINSSSAPCCFRAISFTATNAQERTNISDSEIEAADPFLSKLQKQTEAGYLELLARKDQVPSTEEDRLEEEESEVSIRVIKTPACNS